MCLDLTDSSCLSHLLDLVDSDSDGRDALVLTEGLLVYLEEEHVRALAKAIRARLHLCKWILDIAGPLALSSQYSRGLQRNLEAANAAMRFAPAEGAEFFSALGWTPVQVHSAWDAAFQAKDVTIGLDLLIDVYVAFWERERVAIQRLRAFNALDPELAGSNRDFLRRQAISTLFERFAEGLRLTSADQDRLLDVLWVLTGFESYAHLSATGRTASEVASLLK